jgi:hypothetical protein
MKYNDTDMPSLNFDVHNGPGYPAPVRKKPIAFYEK